MTDLDHDVDPRLEALMRDTFATVAATSHIVDDNGVAPAVPRWPKIAARAPHPRWPWGHRARRTTHRRTRSAKCRAGLVRVAVSAAARRLRARRGPRVERGLRDVRGRQSEDRHDAHPHGVAPPDRSRSQWLDHSSRTRGANDRHRPGPQRVAPRRPPDRRRLRDSVARPLRCVLLSRQRPNRRRPPLARATPHDAPARSTPHDRPRVPVLDRTSLAAQAAFDIIGLGATAGSETRQLMLYRSARTHRAASIRCRFVPSAATSHPSTLPQRRLNQARWET